MVAGVICFVKCYSGMSSGASYTLWRRKSRLFLSLLTMILPFNTNKPNETLTMILVTAPEAKFPFSLLDSTGTGTWPRDCQYCQAQVQGHPRPRPAPAQASPIQAWSYVILDLI